MRRAALGSILALVLVGCPEASGPSPADLGGVGQADSGSKSVSGAEPSASVGAVDGEPLGPGPHDGGASPEQCYRLMERAFVTKDFAAYYDQLSRGSREQLLPMMTLVAGGVAGGDEAAMKQFSEILRRHGIEDLNKEAEPGSPPPADPIELFKDVKDRRELFGEVMSFAIDHQSGEEEEEALGLESLKIEGDVATGEIVKEVVATGVVHREPVRFKREGGRWFADVKSE